MSRIPLLGTLVIIVVLGGCEPEPRQTTPGGQSGPEARSSRAGGSSDGLSATQMAALRRVMLLRRQAAQLTAQRKFSTAMERLDAAMVIAPTIFGARHPMPAQIALQKASVHEAAGSWAKAVKTYDEAIALWLRALNVKEHEPIASALRSQGVALLRWGKTSRAVAVLTRALAMWHRVAKLQSGRYGPYYLYLTRGKPTSSIANCTMELGEAHLRARNLQKAESLSLRALALSGDYQASAQFQVQVNLNLAYLYQLSWQNKKGAHHMSKAVAILAKAGPGARKMHLRFQLRLAELYLEAGDLTSTHQQLVAMQKHTAVFKRSDAWPTLHSQIIQAEVNFGNQQHNKGAALLKALGPRIAKQSKAGWLKTRYHLAVARQWMHKKKLRLARTAGAVAVQQSRAIPGIRPLHLKVYTLMGKIAHRGRGLLHMTVAYWMAVRLGVRDRHVGKWIARRICVLKKKLAPASIKRQLIAAGAEAKQAKIKTTALPACP